MFVFNVFILKSIVSYLGSMALAPAGQAIDSDLIYAPLPFGLRLNHILLPRWGNMVYFWVNDPIRFLNHICN